MTYFWGEGLILRLRVNDEGSPDTFVWEHQRHQVIAIIQQWRIDENWWIARIWREYYKLYTDKGLLVIIYNNLLTGEWFLQWLFD